jgi:hypothetical protein
MKFHSYSNVKYLEDDHSQVDLHFIDIHGDIHTIEQSFYRTGYGYLSTMHDDIQYIIAGYHDNYQALQDILVTIKNDFPLFIIPIGIQKRIENRNTDIL